MKKIWRFGGVAVRAGGGAGVACGRRAQRPEGQAAAKAHARPAGQGRQEPDVPLEFGPPRWCSRRWPDAGPDRVLRAAGGAADRHRARQGGGHAAGADGAPRAAACAPGRRWAASTWPTLTSRVAERSANLESARATLAQAERTHASNERLAAQQFISPIALDNSRAAVDTARAHAAAPRRPRWTPRASACATPRWWRRSRGIVAKRHVLPGEKLGAEQQVLTIVDLARLELAGSVGTHEVARLAPGMAVQVHGRRRDAAGGRPHRAHRAGGRAGHALDRRHDRAGQPEGDAARRPVRAGPCDAGRRHRSA